MYPMWSKPLWLGVAAVVVVLGIGFVAAPGSLGATQAVQKNVHVNVLAPQTGDVSGVNGVGVIVDLSVTFTQYSLEESGFSAPALSGPGAHANAAPFPAPFAPGANVAFPGLVVLFNNTPTLPAKGFEGPATNLAGLFNVVSVTDQGPSGVTLWATWITAAPLWHSATKLTVAIVSDLNHDGIFNDAPNIISGYVPGSSGNSAAVQALMALGVASNIVQVSFTITPAS